MCINRWGVHFRSRILKVPFGDQGFCIRKDMFQILGGFPDNVPYGEDHIFVWKARQQGVKLQPVCSTLYTSARKYKKHGWLKTTLLHQYLWVKQAWPQWQILRRERKKGQEA
jgi:GT2 family glycosyltransferase